MIILREEEFTKSEKQAISRIKNLLLPRFPNGGITFLRLGVEKKSDILHLTTYRRHPSEIAIKMLKNQFLLEYFKNQSIDISFSDLIKERVKFNRDGFQLIAVLARRLFNGGCYFSTLEQLNEYKGQILSAKECLYQIQMLIDSLFGENYNEYSVLELEDINWNDWFLAEYFSSSYFVFDKQMGTITVIMIRDTD